MNDGPTRDLREAFLADLADASQLVRIFEHVPGLAFFAKDRDFRLVLGNETFFRRFGFESEAGMIGATDFEIFPRALAEKFRADDERVLATGRPLQDLVELFLDQQGMPDWFLTRKVPLFDRAGVPCGVMGVIQPHDPGRDLVGVDPAVAQAANLFRREPGRRWKVGDVARLVGMSQRHFDRKFRDGFGVSPQTYLLKTRIQAACGALRQPGARLSEVAVRLGFCDQSAFTAQFRRHMGVTPLRYQQQFRRRDG
jgi:AraC-like DNA-binding protein